MISGGFTNAPKDTGRKALEFITIMNMYEKILAGEVGKRSEDLANIGLEIIDQYIKENKRELD